MFDFIHGKKTYVIALGAIVFALYSVHAGSMDWNTAMQSILAALGGAGLRHSIEKAAGDN